MGFIQPMRPLSTLALLLTAAVLPAQDFDFRGVPADSAIAFATAGTRGLKISDSPAAKGFKARIEKIVADLAPETGADQQEITAAVKAAAGLDLESPDTRIAGGFAMSATGLPTGGVIVRARHDGSRLAAHAAAHKVGALRAGNHRGWVGRELLASLGEDFAKVAGGIPAEPADDADKSEPIGVFDVDNDTIVIAQPKEAARIIALLRGQGASYALSANLRPQLAATGRPYAVVSVNAAKLPASAELAESGFLGGIFAMGENNSHQVLKLSATFTSKEKAAPVAMQAQGMMAMLPMMAAGDPTKPQSDEDKEMLALLGEFLAGIQPLEAAGSQVTLTAKWDTKKLLGMMEKLVGLGAKKAKEAPAPIGK